MDLGLKRAMLVILSLGGGVAGLFLVFGFLNLTYGAGVNFEEYGLTFSILTVIPIALFVAIWLDYFMGTGILEQ